MALIKPIPNIASIRGCKKKSQKVFISAIFLYYLFYIGGAYYQTIVGGFCACIVYELATTMTADSA